MAVALKKRRRGKVYLVYMHVCATTTPHLEITRIWVAAGRNTSRLNASDSSNLVKVCDTATEKHSNVSRVAFLKNYNSSYVVNWWCTAFKPNPSFCEFMLFILPKNLQSQQFRSHIYTISATRIACLQMVILLCWRLQKGKMSMSLWSY